MIERLLKNLHPAINPDPQAIPALTIHGNGTVIIDENNILQLIGNNTSAQFDLRTYTLGALANDINNVSGFSATCNQLPSLSAIVLLAGTYSTPVTINMFTSLLWQLLKPVALALLDALQAANQSILEWIMNTSDGSWLDAYAELFGIQRLTGEPDSLFAIRVFDLSVAPRVNNIAIQKTLQDIGYIATISDRSAGSYTFDIYLTLPTNPPKGFIYSMDQMSNIVNQIRPAGIQAVINIQNMNDGLTFSESITQLSGTTQYATGRKWGQMIWS
jgi:hypothetical protein